MKETIIDLIRHGEPVGGRKYRGYTIDDPLSEKGWTQMREAVGGYDKWDCIVSSPMLRCKAFAEELAEKNRIPLTIKNDFEEVGFGDWEGKSIDEVIASDPQGYEAFYLDPVNARPNKAEDLDVFFDRVVDSYNEVLQEHENQHCLIVAHAGVIRAVIAHILYATPLGMYRINVKNAGLVRIKYKSGLPKLDFVNGSLEPG